MAPKNDITLQKYPAHLILESFIRFII